MAVRAAARWPRRGGPAALREAAWEPVCPRCGGAVAAIATHEDAPLQPGSVYAATKAAQERLVRIVGSAYAMPTTILRYFNVYGPGQSLSNPYTGILSTFYARARSGKAIDVYEDGRETPGLRLHRRCRRGDAAIAGAVA